MAGREGLDVPQLGTEWLDDLLDLNEVEVQEALDRESGFGRGDFDDLEEW